MKITKIIKKRNNQYQILLSDNTSLSFYDDTIIHFNLLAKKDFSEEELKNIIKYNNDSSAYYKALSYLKSKLRTKKEVITKLKNLGYSEDIIAKTIQKLIVQKYLNDELYITSYIADQVNLTLKGPKKIMQELVKLGFKEDLINSYLNKYDKEIWQEKIEKFIAKKIKSNHNLSQKLLIAKLKTDLINLGYNSELVGKIVTCIDYPADDAILTKEINKAYRKYSKKYKDKELEFKIKSYLYAKGFNSNVNISDYID